MTIRFDVNGKSVNVKAEPDTPLLWVIRDEVGLTGTKFGCGMALCGACTVHLDGEPVRSCQTPVSAAAGKKVTTIESLSRDNSPPAAGGLDRARRAAVRLLPVGPDHERGRAAEATNKNPTDADIDAAMSGNICRCGTYPRIRAAIKTAAADMRKA